jgi:hypothetical protein
MFNSYCLEPLCRSYRHLRNCLFSLIHGSGMIGGRIGGMTGGSVGGGSVGGTSVGGGSVGGGLVGGGFVGGGFVFVGGGFVGGGLVGGTLVGGGLVGGLDGGEIGVSRSLGRPVIVGGMRVGAGAMVGVLEGAAVGEDVSVKATVAEGMEVDVLVLVITKVGVVNSAANACTV